MKIENRSNDENYNTWCDWYDCRNAAQVSFEGDLGAIDLCLDHVKEMIEVCNTILEKND